MSMQGLNVLSETAGESPESDPYELLLWNFSRIERQYGVHLHLHDVSGRVGIDARYEGTLARYRYHANPFCSRVKQSSEGFTLCIRQKERLVAACKKTRAPFLGTCPMGVGEYVMPLWWHNQLLGILCAGFLTADSEAALLRVQAGCLQVGLPPEDMMPLFEQMSGTVLEEAADFRMEMESLALLLVLFFGKQNRGATKASEPEPLAPDEHEPVLKGHALVRQAKDFIRTYYSQDLSMQLLASWCFCHPNYLSTVFREKTGVTVSDFIRQVRMEKAAELLDITQDSVAEIASSVGIADANYFSVVFKTLMGRSPTAYRKRQP